MPQIKPKNHTVADMYRAYCKQKTEEDPSYYLLFDPCIRSKGIRILMQRTPERTRKVVMTYTLFRRIIELYNTYAGEYIINGARFDLGGKLGYLHGRRVERDFNRPKPDVIATVQARKLDPECPAVYHTDEDYCLIGWQKYHRVRNESVYGFVSASHTMRDRFAKANKSNPLLKLAYKYYPFIRETLTKATA